MSGTGREEDKEARACFYASSESAGNSDEDDRGGL